MSMLGKDGNKTDSAAVIRARIGIYLTLSALSMLLNGTFLVVLCKSWKFVKGRRITYHVTNLAISDFTVGASTFAHYIAKIAVDMNDTPWSKAFLTIVWTATLTSLLAVCLMAIERAVCIKKPHTWKQILPLKRILVVMAGNWVFTLGLAILLHFYTLTMMFILLVLFFIPIVVTAAVYTYIYITKFWTSSKAREKTAYHSSSMEEINEIRNKRVGSFVLILTLILLTTVAPSFLIVSLKMACDLFELNCAFKETVDTLADYVYMLEITNFVINPIFYVWRMSMYRQAFWKMLGRADNKSPQSNPSTRTLNETEMKVK